MVLLHASILKSISEVASNLSTEVEITKETVRWNPVVHRCWLEIVEVLEAGGGTLGKIEWHVRVTIIDTVKLLTSQEVLNVVLDDWALSTGSGLSPGSISSNCITESEDIIESLVLESIRVHVNETI